MAPSNYGRAGRPSGWMADEVIICEPLSSMSTGGNSGANSHAATKRGAAGHDRCKKDKNSSRNRRPNGNIFTGIVGFFTGADLTKNNNNPRCNDSSASQQQQQQQQRARSDTDRADAMSTPLTAHDSGGEESELRDQDPAPLPQSGWSVQPPVAGGQPKRRTSQPVAIKQASGTRSKRGAQEPRRAPTGARGGGDQPRREEEGGAGGDADEEKIKAWQQRRIDAKRESFTEETFVPCYATLTSHMSTEIFQEMKYKAPERRVPSAVAPPSSVVRPNYHDALRRVAVVVYQHIKTCQWKRQAAAERERQKAESEGCGSPKDMKSWRRSAPSLASLRKNESALWGDGGRDGATRWEGEQSSAEVNGFNAKMAEAFDEQQFVSPTLRYNFMHAPTMALPGVMFTLREVRATPKAPTVDEIYEFIKTLFNKAQLSSECSLVCLIYVERLMETAHVPLLAGTWKPSFACPIAFYFFDTPTMVAVIAILKVWQDLSSWNVEFATVYPEYSLKSINKLELLFLGAMKWDMSISSSLYAKYYFALRSLTEKEDFRRRYNRVLQIDAPRASMVAARADVVKRAVIHTQSEVCMLSKSL
ncbi:unnamed protein product [Scytosiphon promiscuus]